MLEQILSSKKCNHNYVTILWLDQSMVEVWISKDSGEIGTKIRRFSKVVSMQGIEGWLDPWKPFY